MSYRTFFSFSTGLSRAISVPKGTFAAMTELIREVEETLGLKTTQYLNNPPHWDRPGNAIMAIDNELLCKTAQSHNDVVRDFYEDLSKWSKNPVKDGEKLTPKKAAKFWHGLEMIEVPPEKWTSDYYADRMEHLYEVMRGREHEGESFNADPLTPKQAGAVIDCFSFLDVGDIRLTVCEDEDHLRRSDTGDYEWCSNCGGIATDDVPQKILHCKKRTPCPIREECAESYGYSEEDLKDADGDDE
jgi:hypothetical protein